MVFIGYLMLLCKGVQTLTSPIPSLLTAWDVFQTQAASAPYCFPIQPPGQDSQSPFPEGLPSEPTDPKGL